MPFRGEISPQTERLLQRRKRHSAYYQVRQKSHCLLLRKNRFKLRKKGLKIRELGNIFDVKKQFVIG